MIQWNLAKLQSILTPLQISHFFHVYIILGASGGVIREVDSSKEFGKHKTTFNKFNHVIASLNLWLITRGDKDKQNRVIFLLKEEELTNLLFELFEIGNFLESSYREHDNNFDYRIISKLSKIYQRKKGAI